MPMNKGIDLPILHHSDSTNSFKDLGIEYPLSECEIREITFYHINAISPYYDTKEDFEYTSIHTNNTEFICTLPIDKVKIEIKLSQNEK